MSLLMPGYALAEYAPRQGHQRKAKTTGLG
jgi:hypothetical protein